MLPVSNIGNIEVGQNLLKKANLFGNVLNMECPRCSSMQLLFVFAPLADTPSFAKLPAPALPPPVSSATRAPPPTPRPIACAAHARVCASRVRVFATHARGHCFPHTALVRTRKASMRHAPEHAPVRTRHNHPRGIHVAPENFVIV